MWKFYRQLVCQLPGLLWEASERVRTLIAAARFLLLAGHKEYLSEAAVSGWASFSAWWSVVPIGALFFWGLLKANHQVFLSAERAHATTVTGLTQELQLARTVVPESVAFLKAEMDRRFEEHKAQLGTMSAQIDKLTAPGAPSLPGAPKTLSVGYVEAQLRELGHSDGQARLFGPEGVATLRSFGIDDEAGAQRFFEDKEMLRALDDAYLNDLGRAPGARRALPLVDPSGLFTWGLRIHTAPPDLRSAAITQLRETLRAFRRAGAK